MEVSRSHIRTFAPFAVLLAAAVWPFSARADDLDRAIKLARQYLAGEDGAERRRLEAKLAAYDGDIQPVLDRLSARTHESVEAGYHPQKHFSDPDLREKHPDGLLYFMVPESYRPDTATGLIIFLHGGGKTSSRRAPRLCLNVPANGQESDTRQLGDVFAATGMIAVGPSAPWNENSYYRWCLRESDEYLADVIRECEIRFHIDRDRVFLVGHSMGGFGAYHHVLRQPDRFAAVIVNSGSWKSAYLPAIRGTPLCIIQGVHDARPKIRWHQTDVEYGRWTDKLLTQKKIDHTYFEHDGAHAVSYGRKYIAKFLGSAASLRRDPCYPHVVLATPVGFRESFSFPVEHNRWLTLNEATRGKLEYDELVSDGADDFDDWGLEHRTSSRRGAAIGAINRGDNTIVVSTRNVARFIVWLQPRMIDIRKSVTVVVDGKTKFAGKVRPSLATALESYDLRQDWGLVYPMKIELDLAATDQH